MTDEAQPLDEAAADAPAPRRRPKPGNRGEDHQGTPRPAPSPFRAAAESRPGDDVDEQARAAGPARPRGGNRTLVRGALRMVVIAAIAVLAWFALRSYVVEPYYIPSESMEPTLHGCATCNDDHVLVDKISYRVHDPRRGDIVVFDRPPNSGAAEPQLIKRIVGLPGDTITLRGGKVLVNGTVLDESYLHLARGCPGTVNQFSGTTSWTIPSGDLFVMGDNRCDSADSRYFGPIKESTVVGRAFAIIWPLSRVTFGL